MAKRKYSLMGEVQKSSSTIEPDAQPCQCETTENATPSISVASVNEKPAEIRATFIVSPNLIRKLKLIGMLENRKHKDVINEALSVFIRSEEHTSELQSRI